MEKMTFWGYRRPDGRVGIRNKILILPASVCASDTTRIIASQVESAMSTCPVTSGVKSFKRFPWESVILSSRLSLNTVPLLATAVIYLESWILE